MATPLRLGLIGAGRWGRNYIKTIGALEDARLARLGSANPESASLAPPDCIVASDWREMLDAELIDGVIIATPPSLHAEMAMVAVEAGLPVLVEKPLTLNHGQAVALREFVRARNGFVMVGHTHLFHPAYRTLKEMAPRYGTIRAIRGEAGNWGPFRSDAPVLWDWGAHDIALCLDLLGADPLEVGVRCLEMRQVPEGLGQVFELQLVFPRDIRASIRIGNLLPKTRQFSVEFDRASLIYDDLAQEKLTIRRSVSGSDDAMGDSLGVSIPATLPLNQVVRDFVQAIAACSRNLESLDLGVRVAEVLSRAESCLHYD